MAAGAVLAAAMGVVGAPAASAAVSPCTTYPTAEHPDWILDGVVMVQCTLAGDPVTTTDPTYVSASTILLATPWSSGSLTGVTACVDPLCVAAGYTLTTTSQYAGVCYGDWYGNWTCIPPRP